METRACIKQCFEDIKKYGAEKTIMVEQMSIIIDGALCGSLCDYSLTDKQIKTKKDSNKDILIYSSTLGELLFGDQSPLSERRLYCTTALQEVLSEHDIINKELLTILIDAEKENANMDINIQKKFNLHNANPEYYLKSAKAMCDNKGIIVGIEECCKQDIVLFGEDCFCNAKLKYENDKEILVDWVLYPCLGDIDIVDGEDYRYLALTLSDVNQILQEQATGKYRKTQAAKIYQFKTKGV